MKVKAIRKEHNRPRQLTEGTGAAISANAKNPEQIVKFLDLAYSEEGQLLFDFGIDGQSYSQVDGYPTYMESVTKNPDGLPFGQALVKYVLAAAGGFPFIQDKRYYEQFAGKPVQKEAIQTWMQRKNDKLLPPVTLTAEEGDQVGSIMNDVWTYRDEMLNKFIMGAEPIETSTSSSKRFKAWESSKRLKSTKPRWIATTNVNRRETACRPHPGFVCQDADGP